MMGNSVVLNNLQERNNLLQSKLIHDQLKYGTYHFGHFKKCLPVITEYKKLKSFYNVSSTLKISQIDMIDWFVQGQMGNTKFRRFYLAINGINRGLVAVDENDMILEEGIVSEGIVNEGKDYIISQYGNGWSYKTFIDGEKVFIMSDDLKTLKEKVKAQHLPLD